jgi:hypothetical protein
MTDRTHATDATSHKTNDAHHVSSLSYTDAQGHTHTAEQMKEKQAMDSKAMVGTGVIPSVTVSDQKAPTTPAPKPEGFFGGIESGAVKFWNAAVKDTQAEPFAKSIGQWSLASAEAIVVPGALAGAAGSMAAQWFGNAFEGTRK